MGVGSNAKGNSILIVNEQTTYETWEFLYDPRIEKLYAAAALNGGAGTGTLGPGQTPSGGFGPGATGFAPGSTGFGGASGTPGGPTGSPGSPGGTAPPGGTNPTGP
jgi:hypothetical protein